jgi:hypothetical protein
MAMYADGTTAVYQANAPQCNSPGPLSGASCSTMWANYSTGQPSSWCGITTSTIYQSGCTVPNSASNISMLQNLGGSAGADSTISFSWSCSGNGAAASIDVCGGSPGTGQPIQQCE